MYAVTCDIFASYIATCGNIAMWPRLRGSNPGGHFGFLVKLKNRWIYWCMTFLQFSCCNTVPNCNEFHSNEI